MKAARYIFLFILHASFFSCSQRETDGDWIKLFNGKDLNNWEANENPGSFKVDDGIIVANGLRSHLFYVGNEKDNANFTNFELTLDVMTHHLANSGVYFHTAHQEEGWLDQGYELQINSTHRGADGYKEVKKGGSLYGVRNLYKAYTKDSTWYNFNLRVEGKHIQIKINDQLVVDYVEPSSPQRDQAKKVLSSGMFALQGHDPESTVYFKNILVKRLPDSSASTNEVAKEKFPSVLKHQANHFAFIDENIHTSGNFNIDSAMQSFYNTGINLGLVIDAGDLEQGKETETLADHLSKYKQLPVFLGLFRNNLTGLESVPDSITSQFDYIIGDITWFEGNTGRVDVLKDANVDNKEKFMDDYIKAITEGLDKGGLNIWASATLLPESLLPEYDQLWNPARMAKVIDAAKRNTSLLKYVTKSEYPACRF
jgi:hypothetical protein